MYTAGYGWTTIVNNCARPGHVLALTYVLRHVAVQHACLWYSSRCIQPPGGLVGFPLSQPSNHLTCQWTDAPMSMRTVSRERILVHQLCVPPLS
jgi:hypothetical protein